MPQEWRNAVSLKSKIFKTIRQRIFNPKMEEMEPENVGKGIKSRQQKYKETMEELRDFGLSLSVMREVFKAKTRFWNIFWVTLGLICFSMCWNEVIKLFTNLIEIPTSTKISYIVNTSILFPTVSICTYARINKTKVESYNISDELLSYMMASFRGMYLFYNEGGNQLAVQEELEDEYQDFIKYWRDINGNKQFRLIKFFMEEGIQCNKFLSNCMFQGSEFECCKAVDEIFLTDIGKCFVIKLPSFNKQTIPGPMGGLKVYVSNWGEYYPETLINSNPDMGIQLHVVHPDLRMFESSDPIIIFPETHALVQLRPVRQELFRKVVDGNPTCRNNYKLHYYPSYSTQACFAECIANMTYERCNCIQIGSIPQINLEQALEDDKNKHCEHSHGEQLARELGEESDMWCTPALGTKCVQTLIQDRNSSFLWDYYDIQKSCNCPIPCKMWKYESTVSYSFVANPGYQKAFLNLPESEAAVSESSRIMNKQKFVILDVFFDKLMYSKIMETQMFTYSNFLASLGGQMSVWLGIRLMTIIQLLYFTFALLLHVLPYKIRQFGEKKGFTRAKAGSMIQFKQPVRLYPTATTKRNLFEESGQLHASTVLNASNKSWSRSSSLHSSPWSRNTSLYKQHHKSQSENRLSVPTEQFNTGTIFFGDGVLERQIDDSPGTSKHIPTPDCTGQYLSYANDPISPSSFESFSSQRPILKLDSPELHQSFARF